MWQCDNCGYTDEDGTTLEEETEEGLEDTVRYCPECGSDEVFMAEEGEQGIKGLGDEKDDEETKEADDWNEDEVAEGSW